MKRARGHDNAAGGESPSGGGVAAGKRTLAESLSPVQRKKHPVDPVERAATASPPAPATHEDPFGMHLAEREAPAAELPHRAQMERLFGEDLSGVTAHVGASASLGAEGALGAAKGETVAFAESSPSLALVAHEAAHVVQHRRAGGSGAAWKRLDAPRDDAAEREADAVSDLVATKGEAAGPVRVTAAPSAPVHFQRAAGGERGAQRAANPNVRDPIVSAASDEARRLPKRVLELRRLAEQFSAARDHLDGDRVGELGIKLASAFAETEAALARLDEGVSNADLLGPVGVDYSWDPRGDKSGARASELEAAKYARDDVTVDLAAWSTIIANHVRPTSFRHADVPGAQWAPRPEEMPGFIRGETTKTILLIDAVHEVQAMLAGAAGQPSQVASALRREAANRLQFWLGDRDAFLFLSHALGKLGHGDLLDQRGHDGKELKKTLEAVTRGVPQTVADIIEAVREAKARDLDGDGQGALMLLGLARERVNELASYDKVKKAIPKGTHGLTLETALFFVQEAQSGLREQERDLQTAGRVGEGLWDYRLRQLETASDVLKVMSGEEAYGDSFLTAIGPASKTSLMTAGIMGGTIVAGAAGATWIAASAAAIAEVGAGAYAAAVTMIVRNPYAATALAEFAGGIGLSVVDAGGIENFLESLKSPEGMMQLAMELLILKQSLGGGRYATDAGAPDAQPRRSPDMDEGSGFAAEVRDFLDRTRAFKAAAVEWAKQPRRPGAQPAAVTPDGNTTPVPGRASGDDLPGFDAIYAKALGEQRAGRAARGGRRVWPSSDDWEQAYHAPPAGKDEVAIRERLLAAAKEKYRVTPDMLAEQQADLHQKQREYFAKVESNARERREQLEADLAGLLGDDAAWKRDEIEAARRVEAAAKVKPTQGRLPINHEFAGTAITIDDIDAKLADVALDAGARTRLQRARKVMAESGVTRIEYTDEGYPDFSPWVYEKNGKKAEIDMYLQGTRGKDDTLAEERFGEMIGDPDFEAPTGWTWHHSERTGKMLLVPTGIHEAFKHTGGIPLYRVLTGDYDAYRKSGGKDDDGS